MLGFNRCGIWPCCGIFTGDSGDKLYLQAAAQSDVTATTEDLLLAQHELSVGHEFVETLLQINRNIISSYIEIVTSQLLDSFMDSYTEIHNIQEWVWIFQRSLNTS